MKKKMESPMNHRIKKNILGVLLASSLLIGSDARAVMPVTIDAVLPDVIAEYNSMIVGPMLTAIAGYFTAMTNSIMGTLGVTGPGTLGMINQSINGLSVNLSAANEAHFKMMQAQAATNLQTQVVEQQSLNGAFLGAANTCAVQAGASSATVADMTTAYTAQRYATAAAVRQAKAPPTADQLAGGVVNHRIYYCNPDTDPKKCSDGTAAANVPLAGGGKVDLKDADVKAKSLFDGVGDGTGNTTNLTYTKDQMDASHAFIDNVIAVGDAPKGLSPTEFDTVAGKSYHGLQLAYTARLDLSRQTLEEIASARSPIPGSDQTLKAMLDNTSSDYGMKGYIQDRINMIKKFSQFSGTPQVSPIELLDIQVKSRSDNAGWMSYINIATSDQVRREQVMIAALSLRMQYMQMRQSERIAAMQAITSAETAKANMLPRLQSTLKQIGK